MDECPAHQVGAKDAVDAREAGQERVEEEPACGIEVRHLVVGED
jgi:hypothetical protein